jgi:hypothetical protein
MLDPVRRSDSSPFVVAVSPVAAHVARSRLFDALSEAFSVEFSGRDTGWGDVDAVIVFGDMPAELPRVPTFQAVEARAPEERSGLVVLTDSTSVDGPLRGRSIRDERAGSIAAVEPESGEEPLARVAGREVWVAGGDGGGRRHRVALAPAEIRDSLKLELRSGRFLALAPLVHFLRELTRADGWTYPPPRASFVFDDPNLHWSSYGYIRYGDLAAHAAEHGYHAAMATIPIDGWYANARAARIFREHGRHLSLVVHGNDHVKEELARRRTDAEIDAMLAQALRRIEAFERRAGVHVDRVMVPPHGACSQDVVRGLGRFDIEALCVSDVYASSDRPALAGWHPADIVCGFPVISRHHLTAARDELPLRAFLRQPLVLYGHHDDVSGGLDALAAAAEEVSALGEVEWTSLERIVSSNVLTRREDHTLRVRPFTRRARVEIPEGVTEVVADLPRELSGAGRVTVRAPEGDARATDLGGGRFAVAGVRVVELRVEPERMLVPRDVPPPPRRPRAFARRLLTESRDRARPFVRQVPRP